MSSRKRKASPRFRVGKVSVYLHHGARWLHYRDGGRPVRRKVAEAREAAEQLAAQVNAQVTPPPRPPGRPSPCTSQQTGTASARSR
jgi:hypothetical protein